MPHRHVCADRYGAFSYNSVLFSHQFVDFLCFVYTHSRFSYFYSRYCSRARYSLYLPSVEEVTKLCFSPFVCLPFHFLCSEFCRFADIKCVGCFYLIMHSSFASNALVGYSDLISLELSPIVSYLHINLGELFSRRLEHLCMHQVSCCEDMFYSSLLGYFSKELLAVSFNNIICNLPVFFVKDSRVQYNVHCYFSSVPDLVVFRYCIPELRVFAFDVKLYKHTLGYLLVLDKGVCPCVIHLCFNGLYTDYDADQLDSIFRYTCRIGCHYCCRGSFYSDRFDLFNSKVVSISLPSFGYLIAFSVADYNRFIGPFFSDSIFRSLCKYASGHPVPEFLAFIIVDCDASYSSQFCDDCLHLSTDCTPGLSLGAAVLFRKKGKRFSFSVLRIGYRCLPDILTPFVASLRCKTFCEIPYGFSLKLASTYGLPHTRSCGSRIITMPKLPFAAWL